MGNDQRALQWRDRVCSCATPSSGFFQRLLTGCRHCARWSAGMIRTGWTVATASNHRETKRTRPSSQLHDPGGLREPRTERPIAPVSDTTLPSPIQCRQQPFRQKAGRNQSQRPAPSASARHFTCYEPALQHRFATFAHTRSAKPLPPQQSKTRRGARHIER